MPAPAIMLSNVARHLEINPFDSFDAYFIIFYYPILDESRACSLKNRC